MTSAAEIKTWFNRAKSEGAQYMIVVCDTFSNDDYPVFCKDDKDVLDQHKYYTTKASMQKIMEVYDISLGWAAQSTGRVMNLPKRLLRVVARNDATA